jgi:hypothetical protein
MGGARMVSARFTGYCSGYFTGYFTAPRMTPDSTQRCARM